MDLHHYNSLWKVHEPISIQGHGVKGQGHMGTYIKTLCAPHLKAFEACSPNFIWKYSMNIRWTGKIFKIMGLNFKVIWGNIWKPCVCDLTRDLMDLHQKWSGNSIYKVDELFRYSRSWHQRSRSYEFIYENLKSWLTKLDNQWITYITGLSYGSHKQCYNGIHVYLNQEMHVWLIAESLRHNCCIF